MIIITSLKFSALTVTSSRSMSVIHNSENLKQKVCNNNCCTTEASQIKTHNVILHNTNSKLQCEMCWAVRHNFQQQIKRFYRNILGSCRTFNQITWQKVKQQYHHQCVVHFQVTYWSVDSQQIGMAAESRPNKQSQTTRGRPLASQEL